MNLNDQTALVELFGLATRTETISGAEVDITAYEGQGKAILISKAGTGTAPTMDVKLQDSDALATSTSLAFTTEGTTDTVLRNNTADNIKLSAQWTQVGNRQMKYCHLMLKRLGAIAGGKIVQLDIFSDTTGDPNASIATAVTVSATAMSTSYSAVKFTFTVPVNLTHGTVYHAVLSGDYNVSSTVCVKWRSSTVSSGGNMEIFDAAWAGTDTEDFEIYGEEYNFADVMYGAETLETGSLSTIALGTVDIPLRNNTTDNVELGAKWTQVAARQVKEVWLQLQRTGTIAAGKYVQVRITTDSTGPTTNVLGTSVTIDPLTIPTDYTWIKFEFVKPVQLAASTAYHVVLAGDYAVSSSNHIHWRAKTVAPTGNAYIYDASWAASTTQDFEVYGMYTNKSAVAFTQVTDAAASLDDISLNLDETRKYIRTYATISTAGSDSFICGAHLVALPKVQT